MAPKLRSKKRTPTVRVRVLLRKLGSTKRPLFLYCFTLPVSESFIPKDRENRKKVEGCIVLVRSHCYF